MKPYYEASGITIYHGDAREILPTLEADVMIVDPPYGMGFESGRGGRHGDCSIAGDEDTRVRDSILDLWGARPALVFGRWSVPRPSSTRMVLTWEKGEHVGMGDLSLPWKPNTEEIYVLGSGFVGSRTGSVLRHLAVAGCVGLRTSRWHPMEKPESLLLELIGKCPLGVVVDPTMGSGTTLIACKRAGRQAIGIELEEEHADSAVRRLSQEILPGVR